MYGAREFRLTGEKRGYWPTLELVSVVQLAGKNSNNYAQYFNHFQRNNYNFGNSGAGFRFFRPEHQSQRGAGRQTKSVGGEKRLSPTNRIK